MAAGPGEVAASDAIPRDYNFVDDLFRRFRDKGWLGRTAYIDPRGTWSYGAARRARRSSSARCCERKASSPASAC